ncbi:helix-turn-helix transcriptional regulator [Streptomyces sediminimaris]|uniref:helix-turn-helix transcriptional regulator n=1 Tax=Streptomyces sediminimaris TaxID=3383721 RepID=UPI00399C1ECE
MDDDFWARADDPGHSLATRKPGRDGGVFPTFFDQSGMRAALLDDKLRVVEASVDFVRDLDRSVEQMRGRYLPELLHPSVRTQVVEQLHRLLDGQRTRFVEWVLALRSDGAAFNGELIGLAVCGDTGGVEGLMALLRPEKPEHEEHEGSEATEENDGRGVVVAGDEKLLSQMEARILEGVAAGASTVQLAGLLFLSCGGVEYHLTALLRSMKVRNRSALVSKAYSMGLFCVGSWPPRVLPQYVA